MKGFPIVSIENGDGNVILSEMMLNKGVSDPIAAKLLSNMIIDLTK
jgi:beta-galactosidase